MDYKIDFALGEYVILEPIDKSTVLKADEVATIFKVVSLGGNCKTISCGRGDLVIIFPNAIKTQYMEDKKVVLAERFIAYSREINALELVPEGRPLNGGRVSYYFFDSGKDVRHEWRDWTSEQAPIP